MENYVLLSQTHRLMEASDEAISLHQLTGERFSTLAMQTTLQRNKSREIASHFYC
jgi:hypothetical protein